MASGFKYSCGPSGAGDGIGTGNTSRALSQEIPGAGTPKPWWQECPGLSELRDEPVVLLSLVLYL